METRFKSFLFTMFILFLCGPAYGLPLQVSINFSGTLDEIKFGNGSDDFIEYLGMKEGDSISGYLMGTLSQNNFDKQDLILDSFYINIGEQTISYRESFVVLDYLQDNQDNDVIHITTLENELFISDKNRAMFDNFGLGFVDLTNSFFDNSSNPTGSILGHIFDQEGSSIIELVGHFDSPTPVPEPSTIVLLFSGLFGLLFFSKKL